MNGTPVQHPSDLSKVHRRILSRKMVKAFRLNVCLVEERFEMVQHVEKGHKPRWGYFPRQGHPQVVNKFDGTKVTPRFLQAIAYEVYVKNVTFGLLYQWLGDMGMSVSENIVQLVYLAHVRAKFVKARMEGGEKNADVFLNSIFHWNF